MRVELEPVGLVRHVVGNYPAMAGVRHVNSQQGVGIETEYVCEYGANHPAVTDR